MPGHTYDARTATDLPPFANRPDLACRQPHVRPEIFYAAHTEAARALCRTCPARDECRDWAVTTEQRWGIWGGTTPAERDVLRARNYPGGQP